jgi:hypothetical protein
VCRGRIRRDCSLGPGLPVCWNLEKRGGIARVEAPGARAAVSVAGLGTEAQGCTGTRMEIAAGAYNISKGSVLWGIMLCMGYYVWDLCYVGVCYLWVVIHIRIVLCMGLCREYI